jgi:MFS family permease
MKKFGINFKLVLISQIISLIGGNILRFALLLFILDLTQSAGIFGLVTAASQIPVMLFAIPGGIIADRMNKKKLIVFFDGIKTVICAALLVIFLTSTYSVMNLTIFIAIFMAIVTLFGPILTAATPSVVDQDVLVEANGAIQAVNAMSELLSFVLGGVLIATIGIMNIIILAGIAFLISTVIDLFIKIPYEKQEAEFGVIKTAGLDMKDSLRYAVKENSFIIKSSLLFAVIALLFLPILTVALPYIVRIEFGASDTMFGISQAVSAFGMLLGGMLSGKFKKWLDIKYFSKLILMMASLCLVLAIAVYTPLFGDGMAIPFWLFNIGLMLIMVFLTFGNITVMALVQEQVPAHYLGKIIALVITIANFAAPVGQYVFGLLMELFTDGMSVLFIAIAILTIGASVAAKKMFKTDSEVKVVA